MENSNELELVLEEHSLFIRVVFNPNLDYNRKRTLLLEQTELFTDKLVYVYEHCTDSDELLCKTIVGQVSKFDLIELKDELEKHFENIRGCSISNQGNRLTFYSPFKDINLTVKFTRETSTFEVSGSIKNLNRFLQGYSECLRKISHSLFKLPGTSSLNMTSLTDAVSLCDKIERNLAKSNPNWPDPTPEPIGESISNSNSAANTTQNPILSTSNEIQDTQLSPAPVHMTLCEQIESNLWKDNPNWPEFTGNLNSSTPPTSDSTQISNQASQTPKTPLPCDTPSTFVDQSAIPSLTLSPPIVMKATLPTLNSTDRKLDLVLQKLCSLERHTEKIAQLSSSLDQAWNKINTLADRLHVTETRLTTVETTLEKLVDNSVSKATHNELECRMNAAMESLQQQLNQIKAEQVPTPNDTTTNHISSLIDQRVGSLQSDIEAKILSSQQQPTPPTTKPKTKYTPTSLDNLDHDILLIGDSNIYHIKEDILKHGVSAAKIMAYRFEEAISALNDLKVTRIPDKCIINIGTNHLSSNPKDTNDIEAIKSDYNKLFDIIQEKFPGCEIFISEIFIRREDKLKGDVDSLNSFLKTACTTRKFTLMRHSYNIDNKQRHLKDARHLSMSGFWAFLINIRLYMFSMAPRFKYNQPNHNSRNYRHHPHSSRPFFG